MAAAFSFFLSALFLTVFRTWWVIRGATGPSRLRKGNKVKDTFVQGST